MGCVKVSCWPLSSFQVSWVDVEQALPFSDKDEELEEVV